MHTPFVTLPTSQETFFFFLSVVFLNWESVVRILGIRDTLPCFCSSCVLFLFIVCLTFKAFLFLVILFKLIFPYYVSYTVIQRFIPFPVLSLFLLCVYNLTVLCYCPTKVLVFSVMCPVEEGTYLCPFLAFSISVACVSCSLILPSYYPTCVPLYPINISYRDIVTSPHLFLLLLFLVYETLFYCSFILHVSVSSIGGYIFMLFLVVFTFSRLFNVIVLSYPPVFVLCPIISYYVSCIGRHKFTSSQE